MPIYTKTGDTGSTSLFGGKRVLKCNELVEAYGSLDELNSWIGFLVPLIKNSDIRDFFSRVQSDLFTIGGFLAGWQTVAIDDLGPRVLAMEKRIDLLEKELPELKNFILPGGSELASRTHIARSICRRVERQVVALAQKETVDDTIIMYLNRLSDLLFVFARFENNQASLQEVVWSGIDRAAKKK